MSFDPNLIPIVAILTTFVLFPLAIGVSRFIWKKAAEPSRPRGSDDTARQLAVMQQSIDAMAIEIERISEGQRFITKVLSEKQPVAALRHGSDQR